MKDFLGKHKSAISSTVASVVSILIALLANQLYTFLRSSFVDDLANGVKAIIVSSIIIITFVAIFLVSVLFENIKLKIWPEYYDDQYMKHAFLKIRQLGSNRQKKFQESNNHTENDLANLFIEKTVQNMQLVVESCYDFFESAFSKTGQLLEPIKFESTFMTKSYIDSEITIPCSANKEKRTPVSMLMRKENIKILENTETAKIYKMQNPQMVLVEDTSVNTEYAETYDKQKERIKSSIILPVKSHENELLGTLVVHCNQDGFFKKSRYAFWNELLELFSVELGYHKLVLDYLVNNYENVNKPF